MLQCEDCGARFFEARLSNEYWGECHGRPVYAQMYSCPVCGGAPLEAPLTEENEEAENPLF